MSDKKITGYSIKYWSTAGIEGPIEAEVEASYGMGEYARCYGMGEHARCYGMGEHARWKTPGSHYTDRSERIGRHFFESRDDAVAAAIEERDKKIANLRKLIARIEAVTFGVKQ
jgi:hypothetical protein